MPASHQVGGDAELAECGGRLFHVLLAVAQRNLQVAGQKSIKIQGSHLGDAGCVGVDATVVNVLQQDAPAPEDEIRTNQIGTVAAAA